MYEELKLLLSYDENRILLQLSESDNSSIIKNKNFTLYSQFSQTIAADDAQHIMHCTLKKRMKSTHMMIMIVTVTAVLLIIMIVLMMMMILKRK